MDSKRIKELLKAERKLQALEANGVDNWEYYGEAMSPIAMEEDQEEVKEDAVQHLHDLLVDGVDIDQPAGTGCGYSVTLTESGEEAFLTLLTEFYQKMKDIEKEYS